MKFLENVEEKKYKEFSDNHPKAHFLQSYEWGQFCEKSKGQIAHYVGMTDDNDNLLATALLLEKKTPLGYSYMYSPRGFLTDYTNKEYLKYFTDYLKEYMQKNKVIYIKFDPDLKYQDIDLEANPIPNGDNNYELFNYLISLGYKHGGFYKLYDGNQPRYTFRINLKKEWSEIEKTFSKSFLKSIKRSEVYDLKMNHTEDVNTFYKLMQNNSNKDNFEVKDISYYQNLVSALAKDNKIKFFNLSCNPPELVKKIQQELLEQQELLKHVSKKQEDIKNKISRLEKELEEFSKYSEELVICSLICTYTNNRAWSFYIGNNDLGNLTFAVSLAYYEAIKDAYNQHLDFFDLFGVVGDPHTTHKNLAKIYEFKKKFGDEYIEFIGEFDLINKKFLYKVLPILLKVYRKIRGYHGN